MSKTHSVKKEWNGNSSRRGLKSRWQNSCQNTLHHSRSISRQVWSVSDEDTTEIWESAKEVVIEMVRRNKNRSSGGDSLLIDEEEVEKSF
jgi:hypothetical protein